MSIDRAALIEAAAKALFNVRDDPYDMDEWEDADAVKRESYVCGAAVAVDAALPLIADAIEAQTKEWRRIYPGYAVGNATFNEGIDRAAHLVRGLATRTGDDG